MLKLLTDLSFSFLHVGAFAIGGGYATIPLIREIIIEHHKWLSLSEFTNMITISQMTPGPLAINLSTFVGLKIGGPAGAILATTCCVFTGIILSVAIFKFFNKFKESQTVSYVLKGLRASTTGLIASACSMMIILALFKNDKASVTALPNVNIPAVFVFLLSLVLLRKCKMNMIYVLLLTGLLGLLY